MLFNADKSKVRHLSYNNESRLFLGNDKLDVVAQFRIHLSLRRSVLRL